MKLSVLRLRLKIPWDDKILVRVTNLGLGFVFTTLVVAIGATNTATTGSTSSSRFSSASSSCRESFRGGTSTGSTSSFTVPPRSSRASRFDSASAWGTGPPGEERSPGEGLGEVGASSLPAPGRSGRSGARRRPRISPPRAAEGGVGPSLQRLPDRPLPKGTPPPGQRGEDRLPEAEGRRLSPPEAREAVDDGIDPRRKGRGAEILKLREAVRETTRATSTGRRPRGREGRSSRNAPPSSGARSSSSSRRPAPPGRGRSGTRPSRRRFVRPQDSS